MVKQIFIELGNVAVRSRKKFKTSRESGKYATKSVLQMTVTGKVTISEVRVTIEIDDRYIIRDISLVVDMELMLVHFCPKHIIYCIYWQITKTGMSTNCQAISQNGFQIQWMTISKHYYWCRKKHEFSISDKLEQLESKNDKVNTVEILSLPKIPKAFQVQQAKMLQVGITKMFY